MYFNRSCKLQGLAAIVRTFERKKETPNSLRDVFNCRSCAGNDWSEVGNSNDWNNGWAKYKAKDWAKRSNKPEPRTIDWNQERVWNCDWKDRNQRLII